MEKKQEMKLIIGLALAVIALVITACYLLGDDEPRMHDEEKDDQ